MESTKKSKNIIIGLICLSLLVSIGFNIYQHQQIKKLSQAGIRGESADVEATGNKIPGKDDAAQGKAAQISAGTAINNAGNVDINELEYQLNAAEEELDYVLKQLTDERTHKIIDYTYLAEKNMRDSLDDEYGDLFNNLELSPDELDEFKEILLGTMTAQRDFYRELYSATPSEEKRAELEQRKKDIYDKEERKIIEALGNKVYEKYKTYRDALDEINQVRSFAASLGSDNMLTETQQKALIDAMQKEPVYSDSDSENYKIIFPSEMYTENNIAEILSMHNSYNEAFINAAQGILSPSQLVLLKGYLNKRHDNYENGLKRMVRRQDNQ